MQALGTLIMPVVRHGLTSIGAVLVANGVLEAGMQETFVGFGLAGVGLALSFYNGFKNKAKKA